MDTLDQPINPPEKALRRDRIRTFTLFILILITIVIVIYSALFTQGGNRLTAPLVKNQLESTLKQPITLQTFFLSYNQFELAFTDEARNSIQTKGHYTLFPPRIDAFYDLNLSTPAGINTLKTPLYINGTLKGAYHRLALSGNVKIFHGAADYNATLLFTQLDSIELELHQIKYQSLMDALEYPHDSDTRLNGNLIVSGLKQRTINASSTLKATTNRFVPSVIMEDDNESFDFWSLLADENGKIAPFTLNAQVNAQIDELGILEQFVSYPLQTSAALNVTLQGSQQQLQLNAQGKAAKGDIDTQLTLHKLRPSKLKLDIKHADIPSLFTLLSLPAPISGTLDGSIDSNFSKATVTLAIQKAHTHPSILKREYGITQPDMTFDSTVKMTITPKERHYSGSFKSNLENIRLDNSPDHDQMLQELLRQINQNRPKGEI
ncbi:MAG TPA: hypothetical protein VFX68_04790 [Sulfuricurvum sp.]|nr:hypothetical protein [Sulfuricurvum sp.]